MRVQTVWTTPLELQQTIPPYHVTRNIVLMSSRQVYNNATYGHSEVGRQPKRWRRGERVRRLIKNEPSCNLHGSTRVVEVGCDVKTFFFLFHIIISSLALWPVRFLCIQVQLQFRGIPIKKKMKGAAEGDGQMGEGT